jgi:cell division protein ZapA
MENKPPGITKVRIFDQTYSIRAEKDPEYIARIAEFVDGRMRNIAQGTPTVDTLRVAVLAALNIADDYHQLRQKFNETDKAIGQKALALVGALDQILS